MKYFADNVNVYLKWKIDFEVMINSQSPLKHQSPKHE